MKILMLTQWFDPESCFKGLAFAIQLRRQGHDVSVLTGFPNYPGGKLHPGYRIKLWQRETMDGISVLRVPLYPSHDRSAVRRSLNYLSFALASAIGILTLPRPDIVYVYSPPPTAALGAVLLRALKGVPFVLDMQDMWPDTLGATGMVREGGIIAAIKWWLRQVYRRAARITVLSDGFRRTLLARGVPEARIQVIPNWTHESAAPTGESQSAPSGKTFDILYAGNIGRAQALEVVIGAARKLKSAAPQVRFLIAGDGVDADRLRADARDAALDTVQFLGRVPSDAMPAWFARADALLVHLRAEPVFAITIPSKTQAYLQAGKPILMGVCGDAADMVMAAGAGFAFEPESPAALAEAVLRLIAMPPAERDAMGHAGAAYYRDHLSLEVGTQAFEKVFQQALADSRR